jgi:hypothetical protein
VYDDGDETIRSRSGHELWLAERRAPVLRIERDVTTEQRAARALSPLR